MDELETVSTPAPVVRKISPNLARYLLAPAWPGALAVVPALLVVPGYESSIAFHVLMSVAWMFWIYAIYALHRTVNLIDCNYPIKTGKATFISAFCGTHPINYIIEITAVLVYAMKGTPLPIVLWLAVPLMFAAAANWYVGMFAQLDDFISLRTGKDAGGRRRFIPGALISAMLVFPGAVQTLLYSSGSINSPLLFFLNAAVPIGLLGALLVVGHLRKRLQAAITEPDNICALEADPQKIALSNAAQIEAE